MTKTIEHQSTILPSMHINHSAAFSNEIMARITGFDGALLTLETDMDGMEQAYQDARKKLDSEHEFAMQERRTLMADIERARRMAVAAQEIFEGQQTQGPDQPASLDPDRSPRGGDNSAIDPE